MKKMSVAPNKTAMIPAMYAISSPAKKEVFAAAVIWVEYCGYSAAIISALA